MKYGLLTKKSAGRTFVYTGAAAALCSQWFTCYESGGCERGKLRVDEDSSRA
jgi:hypothetical protein